MTEETFIKADKLKQKIETYENILKRLSSDSFDVNTLELRYRTGNNYLSQTVDLARETELKTIISDYFSNKLEASQNEFSEL